MAGHNLKIGPDEISLDGMRLSQVTDILIRAKPDGEHVTLTFDPDAVEFETSKHAVFDCKKESRFQKVKRKIKDFIYLGKI